MKFGGAITRLAGTYLAIIMAMSLGFSVVFYQASVRQLDRQRPDQFRQQFPAQDDPGRWVGDFLDRRAQEAQRELAGQLVTINLLTLLVGSVVSYRLAQHTLRPIEANVAAQLQFISDASHELRTPLTALRTANEVACSNQRLTAARARQVIAANVQDIQRLQQLTDDMLGLLRDDGSQPQQAVPLQTIVTEAMNLVVNQALAKHIGIDDQSQPLAVRGSQPRLVQLLTILLDNAIKYSPEATTITVQTHKRGRSVQLMVADQGIGMDQQTQAQIFRRFYRADQARTGTKNGGYGLGLAIAQRIVEQHGGKITVISTPDKGTTFTITLRAATL